MDESIESLKKKFDALDGVLSDEDIKLAIRYYAKSSEEFYGIELNEKDINNIFWFHEEHLTNSHQLADTVGLVMQILRNHN